MERLIRVRRLYNLGPYENIEIMDEVAGIQEEDFNNAEYLRNLGTALLFSVEEKYRKYCELSSALSDVDDGDALDIIGNALNALKEKLLEVRTQKEQEE